MTRIALVTGSAGFIGYFTARALLASGWNVVGLDSMSDYYDVSLKERRHDMLRGQPGFHAVESRLEDPGCLSRIFEEFRPKRVFHLAAQAGVRHSIEAPSTYVQSNLVGTSELLEAARQFPPAHMLLASTSSVYGANTEMPFKENHPTDAPMSFYAATKKATEALAHSYAHLFGVPTTMFRFFTVYGPWGRPDMAHFKFTRAILQGESIDVYNEGAMMRDFTYIDDLVEAILALADIVPNVDSPVAGDNLSPVAPFRIVNIGNGAPVKLMDFISAIELACGHSAQKNLLPMQPGDVPATWADTTLLKTLIGDRPVTPIQVGLQRFVEWYRDYYRI